MMGMFRRSLAGLAMLATLALGACILSPGKFDATLDLRKDGHFTFSYSGQIYLLALGQLADLAKRGSNSGYFTADTCFDDKSEERECTEAEIAEQKEAWKTAQAEKKKTSDRESEAMKAMLGGIDPSDPKAAEELTTRLRRQEGWKRVDYRGDGLFDVEFVVSSQLGHDFVFPTFERFPMTNAFVLAHLRQGHQIRIEAPGFAAQGGVGNPFQAMMTGMAGLAAASEGEAKLRIPELDGTFRIVTDGKVLANNTDEGPTAGANGQVLEWRVNKLTQSPPTALIELGR